MGCRNRACFFRFHPFILPFTWPSLEQTLHWHFMIIQESAWRNLMEDSSDAAGVGTICFMTESIKELAFFSAAFPLSAGVEGSRPQWSKHVEKKIPKENPSLLISRIEQCRR